MYGRIISETNFLPSGQPTLGLVDDEKCDGLSILEAKTQAAKEIAERKEQADKETVEREKVAEVQKALQLIKANDPAQFVRIGLMNRSGSLRVSVMPLPVYSSSVFIEETLRIVFREGSEQRIVRLTNRQNFGGFEYWTIAKVAKGDFGSTAVVCFSARRSDAPASIRMQWKQNYSARELTRERKDFYAEGPPSLTRA